MTQSQQTYSIPCPDCGHKQFQKALSQITIGDTVTQQQVSKIIRPYYATEDNLGLTFPPGELQRSDIKAAQTLFSHWNFIQRTLQLNSELFLCSQCRIYQFQTVTRAGETFVFGTVITDGSHNLVDFCHQSYQSHRRRPVLVSLIRALCTPASVARRILH